MTHIIVSKAELPGDRQRFNLGHELSHLILDVDKGLDPESVCHRFVGAILVPAQVVRFELGSRRTMLDMNELYMLKHQYGLSMQAWIFRAKDLGIISENTAARLFQHFRANAWQHQEPGEALPSEKPLCMERLIYRALAEDLLLRSRAQELLGEPLQLLQAAEALQSVLVTDTNIQIDLENGSILVEVFRLPNQFLIPDFTIPELIRPRWDTLEVPGLRA